MFVHSLDTGSKNLPESIRVRRALDTRSGAAVNTNTKCGHFIYGLTRLLDKFSEHDANVAVQILAPRELDQPLERSSSTRIWCRFGSDSPARNVGVSLLTRVDGTDHCKVCLK